MMNTTKQAETGEGNAPRVYATHRLNNERVEVIGRDSDNNERVLVLSSRGLTSYVYEADIEYAIARNAERVTIKFESVSGKSLQSRFNTLCRYYGNSDSPEQWIAEEFKKSLIANIERGTIVVSRDGHALGFA